MSNTRTESTENDIAIVGMACRFPGANTPNQFWEILRDGKESLSDLSDEDLLASGVSQELLKNPDYVKRGMFLDQFDAFDAEFFGFSPLDAKILDPQHRHFLECSWEAFEDAAYVPGSTGGTVGVFAGSGYNSYLSQNLLKNDELTNDVGFFLLRHTGNDKDFLATRVSYLLNLKGPSINVQTACSTSLVAVHMGVQSLLSAECDMALAGGVTIEMPQKQGYLYKESEILSPDGHCRPFDAQSKGTVFGSGVGCVLLKRYDDAVRDNDNIHAVVKGTAINNDGADKVSYLAPSVDGQVAAIQEALDVGEIEPSSVSYIECHGTGTQLGDPIEVAALTQAYSSEYPHQCKIGSVKSNIGHTDTAAGIASLIKVVQSLKNRSLAPTLHYESPNPVIDFDNSPFCVNSELTKWDSESPRRAGVSSLGVGGTNAHVIIEESTRRESENHNSLPAREELALLSAKNELSLQKNTTALAESLDSALQLNLRDVCYTLATGRRAFKLRAFAIASETSELSDILDSQQESAITTAQAPVDSKQVAFMFAGGGSQHANMGQELYNSDPVYTAAVDECLELIQPFIDFDLKSILYPNASTPDNEMSRPSRGLPALFITQYAQTQLWKSLGISIDAMIGHSMGENTAACLSGVFSLKDALGLVALRGRLFESVDTGGMISVSMGAKELAVISEPLGIDIAASNAPDLSVASGNKNSLANLQDILESKEISCQHIHIDVAAHSRMLEDILAPFGDYLNSIQLNPPSIDFISNLSGDWITPEQAIDPDYWVKHLRNTVLFDEGVKTLLDPNNYVLLEVGPGKTLSSLARLQSSEPTQIIEPSMPHIDDEATIRRTMLFALGRLWQGGVDIDFYKQYQECRKLSLPTYQFNRKRHWVDMPEKKPAQNTRSDSPENNFYQPVWQRVSTTRTDHTSLLNSKTVLLITGSHGINKNISDALDRHDITAINVSEGSSFSQLDSSHYSINLSNKEDYPLLIKALHSNNQLPDYVIHTLSLDVNADLAIDSSDRDTTLCFNSLFFLANACVNEDISHPMKWLVLSQEAVQLAGEKLSNPLQSLAQGPCRVVPSECPTITCTSLDIPEKFDENSLTDFVLNTLADWESRPVIAYRGNAQYVPSIQNIEAVAESSTSPELKKGGTYLITGGTGGLGLIAAETLAAIEEVQLVLLSRNALPPREQWDEYLGADDTGALGTIGNTLTRIVALEKSGSSVTHYSADIGDYEEIDELKNFISTRFSGIDGIVHTAGTVDDNLIALKTIDQCAAVLHAKVRGTLVLNEVFDISQLDFMLLYSSISSFTGLQGQIDYAAANCFLDGFAHWSPGDNVTSINWPAWKEDGMAARMLSPSNTHTLSVKGNPAAHPLLDFCTVNSESHIEFRSVYSTETVWMLEEHRLADGTSLIPGSGYMELARAAYSEATGHIRVKISNATFLSPFIIADDQQKEIIVTLTMHETDKNDSSFTFEISSATGADTVTHATGTVCLASEISNQTDVSPNEIMQRCTRGTQLFEDPDHHPNLNFGPRWASLKKVLIGEKEAVIELSLDTMYRQELADFALHPALLDMATGGAQVLIPEYNPKEDFYVPVGYGTLELMGNIPADAYSHVVLSQYDSTLGTAIFDISVLVPTGHKILSVEGFVMKRISASSISVNTAVDVGVSLLVSKSIELGLYSDEGAATLKSIICGEYLPQRIVSVYDPGYVVEQLEANQSEFTQTNNNQRTEPLHDPDSDADLPTIESTLAENTAIEFVAVRSHLNEDGSRRLVAHYKTDDWDGLTVSELRKYAREVLDRINVPQHFVEIDEIPLNDTGQINRTELLDPYAPVDRHVAPRTAVEKKLANIWAGVLGTDKVSLSDNFFDIGGHSLLSIRVIVRAQKAFSIQLDQAQMVLLTLEQQANEIQKQLPDSEIYKADLEQPVPGIELSSLPADSLPLESSTRH